MTDYDVIGLLPHPLAHRRCPRALASELRRGRPVQMVDAVHYLTGAGLWPNERPAGAGDYDLACRLADEAQAAKPDGGRTGREWLTPDQWTALAELWRREVLEKP